ncbi:MAG: hypothetical protein RLZZ595_903 [Bacteroidota bacterium]|jgi:hypothetical protein
MEPKFTTEEIINSLEGIQRAEPSPFLHTRVYAKFLERQNSTELTLFRFVTRPVFVMAMAMLIILMNGYFMMNRNGMLNTQEEVGQSLAVEYGQNTINPYDLNEAP